MTRTPVIVGVGEITHREKDPALGLEPLVLMAQALRAAATDAGIAVTSIDSLDVVCEHSWPYDDVCARLSTWLEMVPRHRAYAPAGGESPVRLIHEAALRIARGESDVAVVVGAEAGHTVAAARKARLALPWTPRDPNARLLKGSDLCHPVAVAHGVTTPTTVYPFYENATLAAWGQTPREAMADAAALWSRCSEVAEQNPHAWSRQRFSPDDVVTPSDRNRLIAWPYTLRQVANPMVNMGAAVLLTHAAHARALGIPEDRMVPVLGGARANEARDFLARPDYRGSSAQDAVLSALRERAGPFDLQELYSCFPVVPKMARRTLRLDPAAPTTATGGLSFFGAPLNNYMTHAAAALVRALRERPGQRALLYGQGEYVTKHHALVLGRGTPFLGDEPAAQQAADAARGPVPGLVLDHAGEAVLETFTVVYDRDGHPEAGVVIALTSGGQRLMARVPPDDTAALATLTALDRSPVGRRGRTAAGPDSLLRWTFEP